jgi:hypothetical protein
MTNHQALLRFVLERSATEPLRRRIKILRGLAAICGDSTEETRLNNLATQMETVDQHVAAFKFSFVKKKTD